LRNVNAFILTTSQDRATVDSEMKTSSSGHSSREVIMRARVVSPIFFTFGSRGARQPEIDFGRERSN
jgi:hypothetical protein